MTKRECPFCGSTDIFGFNFGKFFTVCCEECGACGPLKDEPIESIDAWSHRFYDSP